MLRIWKFFQKNNIEEVGDDWEDDELLNQYWDNFRPTLLEIIFYRLTIILLIPYIIWTILLLVFIINLYL